MLSDLGNSSSKINCINRLQATTILLWGLATQPMTAKWAIRTYSQTTAFQQVMLWQRWVCLLFAKLSKVITLFQRVTIQFQFFNVIQVLLQDYVHTAGASVVHQFCRIGSFSFIGGGSVVKSFLLVYNCNNVQLLFLSRLRQPLGLKTTTGKSLRILPD